MNDNREDIGAKIYDLRKYFNMTQKELCKGICTQAYISKIENGSLSIAADILFRFADRLGVDVNYFYDTTYPARMDYSLEVEVQARELVMYDDYKALEKLIKREEQTPLYDNTRFKQFILWHKALCKRYNEKDLNGSLDLLNQALLLFNTNQKVKSEREIEILINKANIYIDLKHFNLANDLYHDLLYSLKKIPILRNKDLSIRVHFNLARNYLLLEDYKKCSYHAKEGLSECRKNRSLYGMGHLYFVLARTYEETDQIKRALENYQKAKFVFELTEQDGLEDKATLKFSELQDLHKQV